MTIDGTPEIFPPSIHQEPVEYTIRIDPQPGDNTWLVTVRSSTSGDTRRRGRIRSSGCTHGGRHSDRRHHEGTEQAVASVSVMSLVQDEAEATPGVAKS